MARHGQFTIFVRTELISCHLWAPAARWRRSAHGRSIEPRWATPFRRGLVMAVAALRGSGLLLAPAPRPA